MAVTEHTDFWIAIAAAAPVIALASQVTLGPVYVWTKLARQASGGSPAVKADGKRLSLFTSQINILAIVNVSFQAAVLLYALLYLSGAGSIRSGDSMVSYVAIAAETGGLVAIAITTTTSAAAANLADRIQNRSREEGGDG